MSNEKRRLRRSKQFLSASVGRDEIALFNPQMPENYFGMHTTALAIWNLLEQPRMEDEIIDGLVEEFDGDRQEIASDTISFLDQLIEEGIIEADE